MRTGEEVKINLGAAFVPTGTDDYEELKHRPKVNGVELTGDKSGSQLGLVQAEDGKGLSTNDYTTAEKGKLAAVESGAEVNTIEGVQRNGTDLTPDGDRKVNVIVPVEGVQRNGTDLTPDGSGKVNVEVPVLGVQVNGADLTPDSSTKKVNVSVPVEGVQRNGTDLTPDGSGKVNVEVPVLGIQKNGTDLTPDSSTKKVNVTVPVVDSAITSGGTNPVQGGAIYTALAAKAPLASPAFTGNPTAPTQAAGNDSTRIATTAFVKAATDAVGSEVSVLKSALTSVENALEKVTEDIDLTSVTKNVNGMTATVGSAIVLTNTTNYRTFVIPNAGGKAWQIKTYTSSSASYQNYVVGTDENNIVTELLVQKPDTASSHTFNVRTSSASKKLYVMVAATSDTLAYSRCSVKVESYKDVASIDYVDTKVDEIEITPAETTFCDAENKIKKENLPVVLLPDTGFSKETENMIPSGVYFAKYTSINKSTGIFSVNNQNINTVALEQYFAVETGKTYIFTVETSFYGMAIQFFFYDSSKAFLGWESTDGGVYTIPDEYNGSTITYLRVLMYLTGQSEYMATAKQLMLREGSERADYIPHDIIDKVYIEQESQEDNADSEIKRKALSDEMLKNEETHRAFVDNITSGTVRNVQANIYNELLAGVKAVAGRHSKNNPNIIRFSFITDMHLGGKRTNSYDPQYNIDAFISLSNAICDFAVNGGDLITNYYDPTYMTGLQMALDEEDIAHDMFSGLTVPYYIAKGNHDIGVNGFTEVETPSVWSEGLYGIDLETLAIYTITEDNFASYSVTGRPFYRLTGYTYFTNQEIQEVALDGYCTGATFNQSDPYGWYYYKDFGNKLRLIVLNDFYNNGGGAGATERSPYEAAWVESVLSDALTNNLAVLTVSHSAAGLTNADVRLLIGAFKSNGGVYIGHIHGHEHQDVYKLQGSNNIGVIAALIPVEYTLKYSGYKFDIFEVDLENKLLYETRIGVYSNGTYRSEDRVYGFDEHRQIV